MQGHKHLVHNTCTTNHLKTQLLNTKDLFVCLLITVVWVNQWFFCSTWNQQESILWLHLAGSWASQEKASYAHPRPQCWGYSVFLQELPSMACLSRTACPPCVATGFQGRVFPEGKPSVQELIKFCIKYYICIKFCITTY